MSNPINDGPILCPFIIDVDDREGLPFTFEGMRGDAKDRHRPVKVKTQISRRKTGDYGIVDACGHFDLSGIAVERKSHQDAYGTLGGGRKRFEAELARLNELEFGAVVIESSWHELAYDPPFGSRMNPKSVVRSIFAYSMRFPRVHWFPMGSRKLAEATTFRLLERFYRDKLMASAEASA